MTRGGSAGAWLLVGAIGCAGAGEPERAGPATFGPQNDASSGAADDGDSRSDEASTASDGTTVSTMPPPADSGDPDPTTGAQTDGGGSSTGSGSDVPPCPGPGAPLDCSPGPGSGNADTCVDNTSCFLQLVQNSIHGVVADNPTWFDASMGQPYVLEVENYMNAVVERINGAGECSIRDPNAGDEIVVKHDNAFAENFDILTADGYVRDGGGIYTSKCIPAWF